MDPNATLDRIRDLQGQAQASQRPLLLLMELSEAVQDLDEWLSKGGFLPDTWTA
jgi:hypothetical protein